MEHLLEREGIDMQDLRKWERAVSEERIKLVKKGYISLYSDVEECLESINLSCP